MLLYIPQIHFISCQILILLKKKSCFCHCRHVLGHVTSSWDAVWSGESTSTVVKNFILANVNNRENITLNIPTLLEIITRWRDWPNNTETRLYKLNIYEHSWTIEELISYIIYVKAIYIYKTRCNLKAATSNYNNAVLIYCTDHQYRNCIGKMSFSMT